MTFNFDEIIERRHSDSMKWAFPEKNLTPDEVAADPLPMWVADMDFKSPPVVLEALQAKVKEGMFGYPGATQSYLEAVAGWQKKRFGWDASPEWAVQTPGVVTALNTIIQAFTNPGDSVLVQPPVYVHFHQDVITNGRQVAYAPLVRDGDIYRFDAEIFEKAIRPNTKLFILCNPQNPTGNVWSEEDLRIMGDICIKHNILIVSDEIHEDLIFNPSVRHIPFASLGQKYADHCFVCTAPSKTFNIAGLQCSNIFIPNRKIREELQRQLEKNGLHFINPLGMTACEAAYRHGDTWLDEVLAYIRGNHEFLASEVSRKMPKLKVFRSDALYLAWMDCSGLGMQPAELEKFLLTKARVWFDKGQKFGPEQGCFMRVNVGCPRSTLEDALNRMSQVIS